MYNKKPVVVVLSDIHLGTYGCHAKELLLYLKSINPQTLILNGDIIDMWNFKRKYFPQSHTDVIRQLLKMASKGTTIYYIPGNHDEELRKFIGFKLGHIKIEEKLLLDIQGQKHWIFHGDVFDLTTKGSAKLIAKLGGHGYDILIRMNHILNNVLHFFGKEKLSISKKIKSSVKKAVNWINNFEDTAINLAIENGYPYVICGHIHSPQKRIIQNENGSTMYLNSGDWIENLTALEYDGVNWEIYFYDKKDFEHVRLKSWATATAQASATDEELSNNQLKFDV